MKIRALLIFCLCTNTSVADGDKASTDDSQQYAEFSECRLQNGESIAPCRIAYRTFGALNAEKSNAVLVPTWYTGNSANHAFLASAALINPDHYFVIIVDALANGVSSSPSNSKQQADRSFPEISIADMVDSQHRLLTDVLDVPSLYAVVGLSMGGMQAFEWAVRYPEFSRKSLAAIGSPRLPAFDIALWTTQINVLALYRECECDAALEALAGLRMIGQVPGKLEQDVGRAQAVSTIVASAAARRKGISIGQTWDQQRQAEAMISHNVASDFDDDMAEAAARVRSEFLIVIGADDRVVSPQPARNFAALVDAQFIELDEDCGHGDPWCAADEFATLVRGFLSEP